jgi:hypothetical protein
MWRRFPSRNNASRSGEDAQASNAQLSPVRTAISEEQQQPIATLLRVRAQHA